MGQQGVLAAPCNTWTWSRVVMRQLKLSEMTSERQKDKEITNFFSYLCSMCMYIFSTTFFVVLNFSFLFPLQHATGVCMREQGNQTDEMCRKAGYCPTSRGLPTLHTKCSVFSVHYAAGHFRCINSALSVRCSASGCEHEYLHQGIVRPAHFTQSTVHFGCILHSTQTALCRAFALHYQCIISAM